MSLFSSIQLANNALRANQIGMQVVGQNISNVNTPGYIRQEVVQAAAPTQRVGGLLLGLGVEVKAVVQKVDRFLQERLRGASSDRANGETQEQTFLELERLIGELTDTDLSSSLTNFFGAINEVLNQPESVSVRNLAVLQGKNLADSIRRMAERVQEVRLDLDQRVRQAGGDVNRLTEEVRRLNVEISKFEGSDATESDAVGLRDQRNTALAELAELLDIRVDEQPNGAANVSINGTFLVSDGIRREVEVVVESQNGLNLADIRLTDTGEPISFGSGRLSGLKTSRDEIVGGFLNQFDEFARTLNFEFNRVFSSGQGLTGYQDLTSEFAVDDVTAALDAAGLPYTPINGSLQVQVYDNQTGLSEVTDIFVDLDGLDDDDTTLEDLVSALDDVDGISASITPQRRVSISSDSTQQQFAFADDSSGVLAALGVATFFSGTSAFDIGVQQSILNDPGKFAASRGGIGADTDNGVELAGFLDRPLESNNNESIVTLYDSLVGQVTQGSAASQAVAEGFRSFEQTLEGQHLSISGVSLDEEAVRLIQYQHAFQAAARFISTLSELLQLISEI